VGALAVFSPGQADQSRYRRYAIKSFAGQADFAAMREVLMRRYKRAIEEQDLPGLILIDGGKGQLNVAHTVLKDLGIEDTPLASIAKARSEGTGRSPERFFLPGRRNPIVPRQDGPAVLMLARLRDETHRFAITYHRQKRGKSTLSTALTDIPGVGEKRARTLLNRLGSVARIRSAAVEEIAALPGFNAKLAHTVHAHLRNRDAPPPSDAPDAPQEAT